MSFPQQEIAKITAGGANFDEFMSLEVRAAIDAAYAWAEFSCTEAQGSSNTARLKPGDTVSITLGGSDAFKGYIVDRQVAYDARTHAVQFTCQSETRGPAVASVMKHETFKEKTFKQIATSLLAPFPKVKFTPKGDLSEEPFENFDVLSGELVYSAIGRAGVSRNVLIGSGPLGELYAFGPDGVSVEGALVEGQNILRARCLISDRDLLNKIFIKGQAKGTDDRRGDDAYKGSASATGKGAMDFAKRMLTADHPDTNKGLELRVKREANHVSGLKVQADIVVQGWLSDSGSLWKLAQYPMVKSPMMNINEPLGIRALTFKQDNTGGTTTEIEMVNPSWMNGILDWGGM